MSENIYDMLSLTQEAMYKTGQKRKSLFEMNMKII